MENNYLEKRHLKTCVRIPTVALVRKSFMVENIGVPFQCATVRNPDFGGKREESCDSYSGVCRSCQGK
jgi:hypothetical protein